MGTRGGAALYALPLAATVAMVGLVVAANPGRYGAPGVAAGALLAIAALGAAVRAFRRAGGSAPEDSAREDEQREAGT